MNIPKYQTAWGRLFKTIKRSSKDASKVVPKARHITQSPLLENGTSKYTITGFGPNADGKFVLQPLQFTNEGYKPYSIEGTNPKITINKSDNKYLVNIPLMDEELASYTMSEFMKNNNIPDNAQFQIRGMVPSYFNKGWERADVGSGLAIMLDPSFRKMPAKNNYKTAPLNEAFNNHLQRTGGFGDAKIIADGNDPSTFDLIPVEHLKSYYSKELGRPFTDDDIARMQKDYPDIGDATIGNYVVMKTSQDDPFYELVKSHEFDHAYHTPTEPLPFEVFDSTNDYLTNSNNTEIAARGSQMKDWFGFTSKDQKLTPDMVRYFRDNYPYVVMDNNLTEMFNHVVDMDKFVEWLNKHASSIITTGGMATALKYYLNSDLNNGQRKSEKFKLGGIIKKRF